jgi:teichuronic acid biosynthesis glycosyltransferase TuaC
VRVLVVSHLYPAPGDDYSLFVHDQARALQALGVDVRVISPTPWMPRLPGLPPRLSRRATKPSQTVLDGIPVAYPRVLQPPRRMAFARLGDLHYAGMRRLLPGLRETGFDLVHAHQALPDGAAAERLAAALGVPFVVSVHGIDVHQHLRQGGAVASRTAATLRAATAVMPVSSAAARDLASMVPADRLHVVLNGTSGDSGAVQPAGLLPGKRLLLSVGNLNRHKGFTFVMEALGQLRREGRDLHYAIVGDGPLRGELVAQARRLGISQAVQLLGRRPHAEVLALMARADVFVLPSHDEAFGLVYVEAMSQGTPVIGCRGEGCEDFIVDGESGFLVPQRDSGALTGVISQVLDDPARTAVVAETGRGVAAALTWERNARRTLQVYQQALAAAPRQEAP